MAAAGESGVYEVNNASAWVDPVFTALAKKADREWKNVFLDPKGAGLRVFLLPYFWGTTA